MTTPSDANADSLFNLKSMAATTIAVAAGLYAGIHFIVPTTCAVVLLFIATKLFPESRRRYIGVFAWQAAHAVWLCLALLTPTAQAVVIDIVLVSALLTWLLMRPGYAPLYALAIYQFVSLYANGSGLWAAELNTPTHKALFVHVLFRVIALAYIAIALFDTHREARRSAAVG